MEDSLLSSVQGSIASDLSTKIQTAVMVKAQDAQKQQGAEIVQMIKAAADAAQRGGVDTYA